MRVRVSSIGSYANTRKPSRGVSVFTNFSTGHAAIFTYAKESTGTASSFFDKAVTVTANQRSPVK